MGLSNARLPFMYLKLDENIIIDLDEKLGAGRMADVYHGRLRSPHDGVTEVAVKIARPDLDENQRRNFDKEAEILRRLERAARAQELPALPFPRLIGHDPANETSIGSLPVVVLEFIPGEVLSKLLTGGALEPAERSRWLLLAAKQYGELLTALHAADLTCSDRKLDDLRWQGDPQSGHLVVLDWNVVTEGPDGRPRDLEIFGQFWYELATGEQPKFVIPLSRQPIFTLDHDAVPAAFHQLPGVLQRILRRALHPVPEARYLSVMELGRDIDAALESGIDLTQPTPEKVDWCWLRDAQTASDETRRKVWDVIANSPFGSDARGDAAFALLWAELLIRTPENVRQKLPWLCSGQIPDKAIGPEEWLGASEYKESKWLNDLACILVNDKNAQTDNEAGRFKLAGELWGKAVEKLGEVRNEVRAAYRENSRQYCAWDDLYASEHLEELVQEMLKAMQQYANIEEPREIMRQAFKQALAGNPKMLDRVAPVAVQWSNQDPAMRRLKEDLPQLARGWLAIAGPAPDTEFNAAIQDLGAWRENPLRMDYERSLQDGTDNEVLRKALEDRDLADLLRQVVARVALQGRVAQLCESLKARLAVCRARNDAEGTQAVQQWARQLASAGGDGEASWLADFGDAADEQTWSKQLKALIDETRKAGPLPVPSPAEVEPANDAMPVTDTTLEVTPIEELQP